MTTERDTEVSEPVAWMKWHKIYGAPDGDPPEWDVEFSTEEIAGGTPLYAAPVVPVAMTDEEIDELWVDYRGGKDKKQWRAFARAIEAKLRRGEA